MSEQQNEEWSCPIEEAGKRFFGMSKSGSYAAARKGLIPVVRIGGKFERTFRQSSGCSRPPNRRANPIKE